MTPLRQKMIEDMQLHGLSGATQKSYVGVFGAKGPHDIKTRDCGVKRENLYSRSPKLLRFCFALNRYAENKSLMSRSSRNFGEFFVIRRVFGSNSRFFDGLFAINTAGANS
jgi:hypothetical protein